MAKLREPLLINIAPKSLDLQLARGLTLNEYKCKCTHKTCHYTLYARKLVKAYEKVRVAIGVSLSITSGYRCQVHNASDAVKGVVNSSHTSGHAIDISFKGLTPCNKNKLMQLARENFDYVRAYDSFMHCQINA